MTLGGEEVRPTRRFGWVLIRRLEEAARERRVFGPLGAMSGILLLLVGLPMSSVATGSWGQISRHGVAPLRVYLVVVVSLVVVGLLIGAYAKLVLSLVRRKWLSAVAVGLPVAVIGTVAGLFTVLDNWPDGFLVDAFIDVRILQLVFAVVLFASIGAAVIRLGIHGALAVIASLAMLVPFVPLQLQQGGLRASALEISVPPGAAPTGNVLWIIPDELSASAMLRPDGRVWEALPNLRQLQDSSTTYVRAVSVSINTSQAIPAMLSGIADLRTVESGDLVALGRSRGALEALSGSMDVVVSSPFFTTFESAPPLSERLVGKPLKVLHAVLALTLDLVFSRRIGNAITGPRGFIGRFFADSDAEFWGTEAQRSDAVLETFSALQAHRSEGDARPWFFLWHSLDTHGPWNVDADGREIYEALGTCSASVPCTPLTGLDGEPNGRWSEVLARRMNTLSVQFFDARVGHLISQLKATGQFDRTTIVIGADHGTAIANEGGGRHSAGERLMVDAVAHVPLLVKYANQDGPVVVHDLVSMGQILSAVLDTIGVQAEFSGYRPSPRLPRSDGESAARSGALELGTWTGYDDFWSWRIKTWLPVSDVDFYGGNDWYAEGPADAYVHLGFPQLPDLPSGPARELAAAQIQPLAGDSPVAFVAVTYEPGSCAGGVPWVLLGDGRHVETKIALPLADGTALAWAAIPRSGVGRAVAVCVGGG